MSNVDWSKAPEGATHCCDGTWYKKMGGKWYYCFEVARSWTETAYADPANFSWWRRRVERPAAPQWNGEGLPPVGTACEVLNSDLSNAQWEKCKILFVGVHRVVYDSESCSERVGYADTLQFRPIRTAEQLAAEARERAVEEMWSVYWQPHVATAKEGLGLLYDAGYRKQEQPE